MQDRRWMTTLFVVFLSPLTSACLCLLLGSAFKCPSAPTCCESGQYALDECGCCKKCAKAELQTCGGASDISGRCADGLQCLKTCLPCQTVGSNAQPCIFPFKYANETFHKCTSKDSDYGQPWCATAVDEDGYVIDHAWGDCADGCPGTRIECDDRYFAIQEGKCIDVSVPGSIPNWFGAPVVKLEPPTQVLFPAPVCSSKGPERLYENTCRCARGETALDLDINGAPRGNCTGLDENGDELLLEKIWCFLENVRDPKDPRNGCYSDTTWSARDGRYWSALACRQNPDVNVANWERTDSRRPGFSPREQQPPSPTIPLLKTWKPPLPGPTFRPAAATAAVTPSVTLGDQAAPRGAVESRDGSVATTAKNRAIGSDITPAKGGPQLWEPSNNDDNDDFYSIYEDSVFNHHSGEEDYSHDDLSAQNNIKTSNKNNNSKSGNTDQSFISNKTSNNANANDSGLDEPHPTAPGGSQQQRPLGEDNDYDDEDRKDVFVLRNTERTVLASIDQSSFITHFDEADDYDLQQNDPLSTAASSSRSPSGGTIVDAIIVDESHSREDITVAEDNDYETVVETTTTTTLLIGMENVLLNSSLSLFS